MSQQNSRLNFKYKKRTYFYKNSDVVVSREKGNVFLFNTVNGQLLITNSTGFNIFNLCKGANAEEIINTLIAQYSTDTKNALRKECLYFLKEAERLNLISIKLGGKNGEKEKTKKMEKA